MRTRRRSRAFSGLAHKTVTIGGGSAGILVAAALISAGESDVAVIDPAEARYYWNLMLKGRA